ncbi:MAG: hypothetical protein LBS81_05980 [Endomicrobium sp.]|jgi:heptosyltransferase-2|nr:hypothetical protein [Endomicrobium sp.]
MHCVECAHYKKISSPQNKKRILIIKIAAMGDVLRTTFLLQGLKEIYPDSIISRIVSRTNASVLEHNILIDNIVFNDENVNYYLVNNFFDIVISLDLAYESLSLAKLANKSKILGFTLDNKRNIITSNEFAQKWIQMSGYDDLKKLIFSHTNTGCQK